MNVNCEVVARKEFGRYAIAEAMVNKKGRRMMEVIFDEGGKDAKQYAFLRNEPDWFGG